MTLREIAAEAGVSISTVSRVINQNTKSPVSKEVQDSFIPLPVFLHEFRMEPQIIFSLHWQKILNRRRFVTIIF